VITIEETDKMSKNIQEKVAENKADDSTKQATVLDGRPSGDNPPTGARGARESTEIARVELEQRQQQGMGNGGGGQGGGTTAGTETGQQPVGPFLTVATEAVPMRLETAGSLVRVAANQGRDDHSHLVADLIALSSIGGRMVYVRRDRGRDPSRSNRRQSRRSRPTSPRSVTMFDFSGL